PELVGNRRRVLVSELSGRSNVLMKAHELGVDLRADTPEVRDILKQLKELEHRGYEFEAADGSFILLLQKALKRHKPFFDLLGYRVIVDHYGGEEQQVIEASVKLKIGDHVEHTVAEGDGPVNALDRALRLALVNRFPAIKDVRLVDYKVRILDSAGGTAARTRVLIESTDGPDIWGTVGVSDNLIEASWEALVDSVEYKLLKDEKKK
ncbi:MAG: citramalate synthase, partial [Verrucomicrobia bacterium]|nr:citramalate synthase [Verrucomicrobiota bacterium]